jgi:hypothetical protein
VPTPEIVLVYVFRQHLINRFELIILQVLRWLLLAETMNHTPIHTFPFHTFLLIQGSRLGGGMERVPCGQGSSLGRDRGTWGFYKTKFLTCGILFFIAFTFYTILLIQV